MARGKEAFMGRRCHSPGCAASAREHICTVPSSARGQMTPAPQDGYDRRGEHDLAGWRHL